METNSVAAQEAQAKALAKYLRISVRTARAKIANPPFWLKRIYAMHQELAPEQRARAEEALGALPKTAPRYKRKLTLEQYRTKLEQGQA